MTGDPRRDRAHARGQPRRGAGRAQGDGAKPLAGGQSLIPLMKLRLAAPEALVDLGGLDELRGIRREGDSFVIGALTRHRDLAESDELRDGCHVIAEAASGVGSPAVRNRGTLGGSLAHADPHADLPAALLALDGSVTVRSASGSRSIAAADLVVDYLQTSLADDELIVDVRVPADAGRSAYAKFHRRAIDWSIVGAAAVVRGDRVQVAITGLGLAARAGDRVRGGRQRRWLAGGRGAPGRRGHEPAGRPRRLRRVQAPPGRRARAPRPCRRRAGAVSREPAAPGTSGSGRRRASPARRRPPPPSRPAGSRRRRWRRRSCGSAARGRPRRA